MERWTEGVAGERTTEVARSINRMFSSVERPFLSFFRFNHTPDKERTDVLFVILRMPQNWRDTICGQFRVSHWEGGIRDVSEELVAQPVRGVGCVVEERSGSLCVS